MIKPIAIIAIVLGISMTAQATGYYDGYYQYPEGYYDQGQYGYDYSYEQYPAYQDGYYYEQQEVLPQEEFIVENPVVTDMEQEAKDKEKELKAAKRKKNVLDVVFSPLVMGGVAGITTAVIVSNNKSQPSAKPTDQSFPAPCVQAVCYIVNPLKQTITIAPSSPKRRYTYTNGTGDIVTDIMPTAFFASKDYEGLVNQGNIAGLPCSPNCADRDPLIGMGAVNASALINDASASIAGDKIIALYGIQTDIYNLGNIGLQTESLGMKVVGKDVVQEYRAVNVGIISSNSPTNTRGMQGINGVTLINTGSITMTNPQTGTWNYGMELQGSYGYAYNYNNIRADVGMVVTGNPNNGKGGYIFNYGTLTTYRGGMVAHNNSVAINGGLLYLYSNGNNAQNYFAMQGRNNSVLFNDKTGYIEVATLATNYAFDIDSTSSIYNAGEVNCSNGALCIFSPDTDRSNVHSGRCPTTICPPRPPPPTGYDENSQHPEEDTNYRGLWGYIAVSHDDGGVGRVIMEGVADVDVSGLRVTADFSAGISERSHMLYSVLVADNFVNTDQVYSDTIVWKAHAYDDGNGNLNVRMDKVDYTTLASKKTMGIATELENQYHGSALYNSLNVQDVKTFNRGLWQVSGNGYYGYRTPITQALKPMVESSNRLSTSADEPMGLSTTMDENVFFWHGLWSMGLRNNHHLKVQTVGSWDTQKLSTAIKPEEDTLNTMIAVGLHSDKALQSWLGVESEVYALYTKADGVRKLDYGTTQETLHHNGQHSSILAQSGVYAKAPMAWADMRLRAGVGARANHYGAISEKGNQDFALSLDKATDTGLYAHYGVKVSMPLDGNPKEQKNAMEAGITMMTPLTQQQTPRIALTHDGDVFEINQYDKTRLEANLGYTKAWNNSLATSLKAAYIYTGNHNTAIHANISWGF